MAEYIDYGRPGQWQERPPIQVRAREPARPQRGLLPRHDARVRDLCDKARSILAGIEVCDNLDTAALDADQVTELLGQIEDILDLYPEPRGWHHVNPLDYLELTARAA